MVKVLKQGVRELVFMFFDLDSDSFEAASRC